MNQIRGIGRNARADKSASGIETVINDTVASGILTQNRPDMCFGFMPISASENPVECYCVFHLAIICWFLGEKIVLLGQVFEEICRNWKKHGQKALFHGSLRKTNCRLRLTNFEEETPSLFWRHLGEVP